MIQKIFIFFFLFFFSLFTNLNAKKVSNTEINEIKRNIFENNLILKKKRSGVFKKEISEELKKAKLVFESIKKKKWKEAKRSSKQNESLSKLVDWYFLEDNKDPKFFTKNSKFIRDNQNWPLIKSFKKRNEIFINKNWDNNKIINYFSNNPPLTTKGHIDYIDALVKKNGLDNVKGLIIKTWIQRNFTRSQSKYFYKKYKKILTKDHHLRRIERLTWVGRSYEARRMLPIIDRNKRPLYNAKIILRRRAGNADSAVAQVTDNLINDSGLIYERLRWRRINRLYDTAYEIINPLPNNLKYEKKWWYEVSFLIRKFIERKKYKDAYNLAKDFSLKSNNNKSEAEWMAGWIAYEFLNLNSDIYINHFLNSYENTSDKGERARSAYWVARSYEHINDNEKEKIWFEASAKHIRTFYGQLSLDRIKGDNVPLRNELLNKKDISDNELSLINSDLYKASHYVLLFGTPKIAKKFILSLAKTCETVGEYRRVAKLAKEYGRNDLAVRISKDAYKKNINLFYYGYPKINIKNKTNLEKELIYSVIRQESVFDEKAKSRKGARGIMQIMPATAKIVSKQINVKYSKSRLITDPNYNILIGSEYLSSLVDEYDSYLLALVGYNAGPRRIKRWIKKFGDPRKSNVDPVSWIEKIPIKETRLYVKYVLSNMQIYRQMNKKSKNKSLISRKNSI